MNESPFKKNHTYVILDQNLTDRPMAVETCGEDEDEEESGYIVEVKSNQSSNTSIGNIQPKVGLIGIQSSYSDLTMKLFSALLYGICSFLITVINKVVLTNYKFPSSAVLGVGQMVAILVILQTASLLNVVTVRRISLKNRKLWTLSVIYLCNLNTGLGGTQLLSLPMFIALRRFSIAMTAIGEFYLLQVRQSLSIILTIVAMVGGSFIAAAADLSFNAIGYLLVMCNNLFTAANVVYIKKTISSQEVNKYEILFYNALFSIVPAILISIYTSNMNQLYNYEHWANFGFILAFLTSCVMGYLLMFSTVLCTHHNSALTTTIVGTLKNILTTYVGMYIGGDYRYSTLNFVGLNISLVGSLIYSYLTFMNKTSQSNEHAIKK